jgi:hypothetical protein
VRDREFEKAADRADFKYAALDALLDEAFAATRGRRG